MSLNLGTMDDFIKDMVPFFYGRSLSFVDVGAYVGDTFTAVLNSQLRVCEFLLVEPNPSSLTKLKEAVEKNTGNVSVYLFNVAVGAKEGRVLLENSNSMTRVVSSDFTDTDTDTEVSDEGMFFAECKTLDNLVDQLSERHISILKIDVEGYEISVLEGASNLLSNFDVDVVYVEVGMNPNNKQQVYYRLIENYLKKYDYQLFRIYEQMFEWVEDSPNLRRTNMAFMSPKFSQNNPYRLSIEYFGAKEEIRDVKHHLKNISSELTSTLKELDQTKDRLEKTAARREEMKERVSKLITERDETKEKLEKTNAQREEMKERVSKLISERDETKERLEKTNAQREEMKERVSKLISERDETKERLEKTNAQREEMKERVSKLISERDETKEKLEKTNAQREEMKERVSKLISERDETKEKLEKTNAQREEMKERVSKLISERDETKEKLEKTNAQREDIKDRLANTQKQKSRISTKLDIAYVQIDDLRNSLSFRFGNAVVRSVKSPVGWLRTPFRGGKAGVVGQPDKQTLALPDHSTPNSGEGKKPLRVTKPIHIVWKASQLIPTEGYDEALKYIANYGSNRDKRSADLFLANQNVDSDVNWLLHVNRYLEQFDIFPIKLSSTNAPRFSRIVADAPYQIKDGPLVSIIMPAFNSETTIEHSVKSILNQTWRNIELVIVDDCSDDGTWPIIQSLAAQDSRIKTLRNSTNVGPYVSKNCALQITEGKYLTGHDADDWALPQRIEKHINLVLSQPEIRASLTYMLRFNVHGEMLHFTKTGKMTTDGACRLASISCLFEMDTFKKYLGHWDCVRFAGDSELIERARAALGNQFEEFDTIGIICLESEGSLTNHPEFGIRTNTGMSSTRQEYKESWQAWHKKIKLESAYLDFPPTKRPFKASSDILSQCDAIFEK